MSQRNNQHGESLRNSNVRKWLADKT